MSREIPLTHGLFAIVDDGDYEFLSGFRWFADKGGNTFYARRNSAGSNVRKIRMHREIMRAGSEEEVDHINGNGLDNRRSNLRICNHSENQRNGKKYKNNTTGYKGVSWHKQHKKYYAKIRVNNKDIFLGLFLNPEDAARAYNKAAIIFHGEFAKLNVL